MTPIEIEMIYDLKKVTFLPACFDKRFARDMAAMAEYDPVQSLTPKQSACLVRIHYRYRRQHKSARCLEAIADVGSDISKQESLSL